jgi:hypothetical protein
MFVVMFFEGGGLRCRLNLKVIVIMITANPEQVRDGVKT